jgi:hypothetical protein
MYAPPLILQLVFLFTPRNTAFPMENSEEVVLEDEAEERKQS